MSPNPNEEYDTAIDVQTKRREDPLSIFRLSVARAGEVALPVVTALPETSTRLSKSRPSKPQNPL